MVSLNKSSISSSRPHYSNKNKSNLLKKRGGIIFIVLFGCTILLFGLVFVVLLSRSTLNDNIYVAKLKDININSSSNIDINNIDSSNNKIDTKELEHEELFTKTIKSCLPGHELKNQNCRQYIVPVKELRQMQQEEKKGDGGDNGGGDEVLIQERQRVAVLSPPGTLGIILSKYVDLVVDKMKNESSNRNDNHIQIEFIKTGRLPPYGYGKTHGLSKIIRLIPQPLIVGVADSLQSAIDEEQQQQQPQNSQKENDDDTLLDDLRATLRQIIRYHCRLSHVSAHTAILSINMNDLIHNSEETMNKLYQFLKPPKELQTYDDNDNDLSFDGGNIDNEIQTLMSSELNMAQKMITNIQEKLVSLDVYKELDTVLLDEMKISKNLSAWPCQSLWSVHGSGGRKDADKIDISKYNSRIAKQIVPDCHAKFASCFVKRDKCEEAGDGICK